MLKDFAIVRYDGNQLDDYYHKDLEDFFPDLPALNFESRESAEATLSKMPKTPGFEYTIERVR